MQIYKYVNQKGGTTLKIKVIIFLLILVLLVTSCDGPTTEKSNTESAITETNNSQDISSSFENIESSDNKEQSQTTESSQNQSTETPSTKQSSKENVASVSNTTNSVSSKVESSTQESSNSTEKNPPIVNKGELYDLYLYYPNQVSYEKLSSCIDLMDNQDPHPIITTLNTLPLLPKAENVQNNTVQTGFLIVREDYKKTEVNLMENALEIDGVIYKLTTDQYNSIKKVADIYMQKDHQSFAQWLVWMNPNRVTKIDWADETKVSRSLQQNIFLIASNARDLTVSGGTTYTPGSKNFGLMDYVSRMVMTFDNGVTYTMVIDNDTLYLESSDMSFGCQYKMNTNHVSSFINYMKQAEQGPVNPKTAKPVIYLYPEKETEVSVKLNFYGKLTYMYPKYNNGWNVTAYPDGRIINSTDKSEHRYIFWEGISPHKWSLDNGFVVKGKDTEKFLKEKLSYIGLTPFEYNDFITFWVPRMQDNEYNIISFSSMEEYEAIAKLQIEPKPDSILRVHMAWKSINKPIDIPEQELKPFSRQGFTAVEWGGTEVK